MDDSRRRRFLSAINIRYTRDCLITADYPGDLFLPSAALLICAHLFTADSAKVDVHVARLSANDPVDALMAPTKSSFMFSRKRKEKIVFLVSPPIHFIPSSSPPPPHSITGSFSSCWRYRVIYLDAYLSRDREIRHGSEKKREKKRYCTCNTHTYTHS